MIFDKQYGVAFHIVPKNAATTVKIMMMQARSGQLILGEISPGVHRIHRIIDTRSSRAMFTPLPAARYRLAVVRDPVKRFASAYQNKIIEQAWLDPDLPVSEFIRDVDEYMQQRRIETHFEPQYLYLGEDPGYYTHTFKTNELQQLAQLFAAIYPNKPTVPVANKSACSVTLTPEESAWVREVWAKRDYELGYY